MRIEINYNTKEAISSKFISKNCQLGNPREVSLTARDFEIFLRDQLLDRVSGSFRNFGRPESVGNNVTVSQKNRERQPKSYYFCGSGSRLRRLKKINK